jgi:hypothetical protein
MGIAESVRAVMWARKRQPDAVAYGVALGHERFGLGGTGGERHRAQIQPRRDGAAGGDA